MTTRMKTLCLAMGLAIAPAALATYKCVDEKGITRIGETPPDECANVPMQELTSTGQVKRTIAPTPTAAQVEAAKADVERQKEARKRAAEQARLDDALLNTYASDREIDMTRDRNIEPINGRIKVAKERIVAVDKRIKELEDEMEFYKAGKSSKAGGKGKEIPPNLLQDLERVKHERVTLEKSLAGYEKEIASVRAKYDGDKKRWLALKYPEQQKAAEPPAPEPAKPTPAKGTTKK